MTEELEWVWYCHSGKHPKTFVRSYGAGPMTCWICDEPLSNKVPKESPDGPYLEVGSDIPYGRGDE